MASAPERQDRPRPGPLGTLWLPGLLLSSLAILLRILVATRREGIEIDGITYLRNAWAFMGDWSGVNARYPPLYPLLMAPLSGLWGDPEWGARVVSAVLGGLWVWPTLWLARETTDERVSWTAGLLVAVLPAAVETSTRVMPEALFGLCLTALLVSLVRTWRTGSWGAAGLAGVLGGLATLARPEGMGYLVLTWGLLLLAPLVAGARWTGRRALARIVAITLLWLAVMSPYLAAVRWQTGQWHWTGKAGITLRWAESVGAERSNAIVERVITETRREDLAPGILSYVVARPGDVARRVVINLHLMDKYALPGLLQSGGIALFVLGLVHLRLRRSQGPPEWFLAAALLPLIGVLLFVVEARYFTPILPVVSIMAGIGLARVGQRGDAAPAPRPSPLGVLVLAVVLLSFIPWIYRPWLRQDEAGVEKAAGLWLRRTAGPGALFIGRYPVISYYAQARWIPFAGQPLEDVLAEGRRIGARFLIVDSTRLPESRPDLLGLLAGEGGRRNLEVAHVVEDHAGRRVVIYQIAGGPEPS